ncbi:MAG: glycosyltransferase family 2 protein [Verrucomicrobiota bacterium]|jgi:glycosyltransferase involved in cell wall biosynthesis
MRPDQISLIISTYERPGALEQVLQGLVRQSHTPLEILIADDGSGPATRALISQWQARLPVPLRHLWQPDQGFRKTLILNQAIAAAKGDYIVLLDGDCVPHPKFMADHAALAEKNFWVQGRRCFVREKFAPAFSAGSTRIWQWMLAGRITGLAKGVRLPFPLVRRDTGQRGIIGCNLACWRDDLLAINGFDEEYTGWGGEDSDLGTRLYHLGRPRKFVHGRAVVYHLNHPMLARASFPAGAQRLAETIRSGKIRCARGLEQHLSNPARPA